MHGPIESPTAMGACCDCPCPPLAAAAAGGQLPCAAGQSAHAATLAPAGTCRGDNAHQDCCCGQGYSALDSCMNYKDTRTHTSQLRAVQAASPHLGKLLRPGVLEPLVHSPHMPARPPSTLFACTRRMHSKRKLVNTGSGSHCLRKSACAADGQQRKVRTSRLLLDCMVLSAAAGLSISSIC